MKRSTVLIFLLVLLVGLTACRRRIMAEGDRVIYETVAVPETEPETVETVPPRETAPPPETEPTETEPAETEPGVTQTPVTAPPTENPLPTQPPVEVTVTLDPNRGACETASVTVTTGQPYGDLPAAVREGYHFTGWYLQKNGGSPITGEDPVLLREDHTLYAHWAARTGYSLTFEANGGRIVEGEEQRLAYVGDPYGELPVPLWRGYDFLGWFTQEDRQIQSTDVFSEDGNQTLYAHWEYNPYDFWSFTLENITQQIYSCQFTSAYVEYDAPNVTSSWSGLLASTGTYNIAQNLEDGNVTDEWVREKMPALIVKIVSGNPEAAYSEMAARFPGSRILVVPAAAEWGSGEQMLYYRLYFGKLVYPEWYAEVDITTVGEELGVSGYIYG